MRPDSSSLLALSTRQKAIFGMDESGGRLRALIQLTGRLHPAGIHAGTHQPRLRNQ
jgi:hypothetical protein